MTPTIERGVPGTPAMVWTLAAVTFKRLRRGKALWIGGIFALLPVIFAIVLWGVGDGAQRPGGHRHQLVFSPEFQFELSVLLLAVLPAMFVGASVGEELEARTSTYLWSRPLARWAVLAGKLIALTPIVVALSVGGWWSAMEIAGRAPSLASCVGLAAGGAASSLVVASIAVVVPRHGIALTIAYMLVDLFVGAMPFSLHDLSITYHTGVLAGFSGEPPASAASVIGMAVIAGLWTAIGLLRIRRLEV